MAATDSHLLEVRAATPADAPELAALRYRFRSELGTPAEAEQMFVARATAWFAEQIATPQWRGWIALDPQGQLVGHIFLQLIEKIPNPVVEAEQIGYITNAYVLPNYRNLGIGARLLQAALDACEVGVVDTIILWPSDDSRPLYRRAGFQLSADILARRPAT